MLDAYHRARSGPGGKRLQLKSADAVVPLFKAVFKDGDADYMNDVEEVLTNVALQARPTSEPHRRIGGQLGPPPLRRDRAQGQIGERAPPKRQVYTE
jgi:hypothetical protein